MTSYALFHLLVAGRILAVDPFAINYLYNQCQAKVLSGKLSNLNIGISEQFAKLHMEIWLATTTINCKKIDVAYVQKNIGIDSFFPVYLSSQLKAKDLKKLMQTLQKNSSTELLQIAYLNLFCGVSNTYHTYTFTINSQPTVVFVFPTRGIFTDNGVSNEPTLLTAFSEITRVHLSTIPSRNNAPNLVI